MCNQVRNKTWIRSALSLLTSVGLLLGPISAEHNASVDSTQTMIEKPNIVIMLMDDMGWGDLGSNGSPTGDTPNLDAMAKDGMLFTDFYAASPLCSPSRAAMLSGRLPIRNGFYTTNIKARNSYVPQDMLGGISNSEILLPKLLAKNGYRSKLVGKWHLGHSKVDYLPLQHGFDEFFGSTNCHFGPYDNRNTPNIPVFRDNVMIGRYFDNIHIDRKRQVSNLTQVFTKEAIEFIRRQTATKQPYFLLWSPDSLHAPTYRSEGFVGKSARQSSYGDALLEMDHSVGRVLQVIAQTDNNTLVFFTSDNGAALVSRNDGGTNGALLCGKQTTFEGGMREPTIAWWPGRIAPNSRCGHITTAMDLFATAASLASVPLPTDRVYDSNDLTALLLGKPWSGANASMFYYRGDTLMAVRHGPYKAHLWTFTNPWAEYNKGAIDFCPGNEVTNVTTHRLTEHKTPVLFHLMRDPSERYPISAKQAEYKQALVTLRAIQHQHESNLHPAEPVLNMCDRAAMNWSPPGCERIHMCLPKPKSAPYTCVWPH